MGLFTITEKSTKIPQAYLSIHKLSQLIINPILLKI